MSRPRYLLAWACLTSLLFASPVHADESLTYDANHNIETRTLPGGTTIYQYDDLDRVKSEAGPATSQTFTWDPNGNRLGDVSGSHTYLPNSNRQATIAGQSVTLDEAGNIIQSRNLGFVWNTQGQLIEVRQGSQSGPILATYSYDHRNRRTRKVKSGNTNLLLVRTTIYAYDQYDQLIGEFNGAGSPQRTYVWRDNVPLAVISHGGTESVHYIETDHLGSPIAVKDKDGTVVWRWESDAFGSTAPNEDADGDGNAFTLNLRFPGQYYDAESGLHYNHHRYYDPKIGRYLSSDPIGLAGGINTYTYVNGNPVKYADPEGLLLSWLHGLSRMPLEQAQQAGAMGNEAVRLGGALGLTGAGAAAAGVGATRGAYACYKAAKEMEFKRPCQNAILAAALGAGICKGDPADDYLQDISRKEEIRRGAELSGQRKIGNQHQRP